MHIEEGSIRLARKYAVLSPITPPPTRTTSKLVSCECVCRVNFTPRGNPELASFSRRHVDQNFIMFTQLRAIVSINHDDEATCSPSLIQRLLYLWYFQVYRGRKLRDWSADLFPTAKLTRRHFITAKIAKYS